MAREEEDDPFGSIITEFCQPISSDELKLQDCRMRGESESSPSVASDCEFKQTPLTYNLSQVTGILIVSPPETESDEESSSIDKITLLENDEFHTPPEHHNRRSSSSSQECVSQRERPTSEAVIEDKIQQACVDEGIQLEGGENLGVPVTPELNCSHGALETHCSQNLIHVERVVGFEAKLKRYKVLRDELGEHISKKIRVSKENQDCDALPTSETGIEDQVHCTKRSIFSKGKVTEHGDSSTKDFGGITANGGLSVEAGQKSSQYVGSSAGPKQRMEENTVVEEDRVEPCSIDSLKDVKNEGLTVTRVDSTAMDLEDNGGISIEERLDKKAVEEHRVENAPRNLKVKKRSWQELMNAFEVYFKMDQSLKDVDFLETAKRRGLTFPQPRWL